MSKIISLDKITKVIRLNAKQAQGIRGGHSDEIIIIEDYDGV